MLPHWPLQPAGVVQLQVVASTAPAFKEATSVLPASQGTSLTPLVVRQVSFCSLLCGKSTGGGNAAYMSAELVVAKLVVVELVVAVVPNQLGAASCSYMMYKQTALHASYMCKNLLVINVAVLITGDRLTPSMCRACAGNVCVRKWPRHWASGVPR